MAAQNYVLTVRSQRSSFSLPITADADAAAIEAAVHLVRKARLANDAAVTLTREDEQSIDVSTAIAPFLGAP